MPQLKVCNVRQRVGAVAADLVILDDAGEPMFGGEVKTALFSADDVLAVTNSGMTDNEKRAALRTMLLDAANSWKIPEAKEAVDDVNALFSFPLVVPLGGGQATTGLEVAEGALEHTGEKKSALPAAIGTKRVAKKRTNSLGG